MYVCVCIFLFINKWGVQTTYLWRLSSISGPVGQVSKKNFSIQVCGPPKKRGGPKKI